VDEYKTPPGSNSGKAIASLLLGLLSFCFALLTGIPAIILGAWALSDIGRSNGKLGGTAIAVVGIVLGSMGTLWTCVSVALLLPAVHAAREAARRQVVSNNLKMVGLAMHNYHDTYNSFPLAGTNDPKFGVQQSWRARLLPFIEEGPLFQQFNFNEPWDSTTNRQIIDQMPATYQSPNYSEDPTKTVILAAVGPDDVTGGQPLLAPLQAAMSTDPRRRSGYSSIKDGTSNVILVVEADADQASIWTKPGDWEFDPNNPRRGLGTLRPGGFMSVFVDGSVRFIPNAVDDETLRRLFSRHDGKDVNPELLQR